MKNAITNDDRVALAEVDYIIHHMNELYYNKIPVNVLDFITILKKRNVDVYVDPKVPLEEQNLKEFTLQFLILLNLKYWCNDERKKEILSIMEYNQKKFDDRVNDIFNQAEHMQGDDNQSEYHGNANNKPKQVTVVGTPKSVNVIEVSKKEDDETNEQGSESQSQNAIDKLKEETGAAMIHSENTSFFKKFINKLKSFFIKK